MILRPDLLDSRSPQGLEVYQLTSEEVPSCHVYMEAQIFTPDSKRFLLHRSAHPHGSDKNDPQHRYLLCDLEDDGMLLSVTDEVGATAPCVSPDGKYFYYFVNETELGGGRLTLKRRYIDGATPETILVLDHPVTGTQFRPSNIYPLSTIRSDGRKIAISAYLGDGQVVGDYGLLVFDVRDTTVECVLHHPSLCNAHPQYSRSLDVLSMRDIMIQQNHGSAHNAQGVQLAKSGGGGADVHVVRDDGQNLRDLPWGRIGNWGSGSKGLNGDEFAQGHQCWRGRSDWAITSTISNNGDDCQLIESQALPHADHVGAATPGAIRNHLSRGFAPERFYHFATDIAGEKFITDNDNNDDETAPSLYIAQLGEPGKTALRFTYLLNSHLSWKAGGQKAHIHPFLSPDGKTAFFNSAESGVLQAYMIRGLENVVT